MTIQSKTYGKSSGRTYSDVVAGYDVPFSALDLSLSFDTMGTKSTIANLEGEIWKPVLGWEGFYEVSNMGRIKSLNYNHTKKERLIKARLTTHYLQICFQANGRKSQPCLQRVVYEAFNGKLPEWKANAKGDERMEINHIDENPLNNRLDNLELITMKENCNYGTRIERMRKNQINKQNSKTVYQYSLEGELIKVWPSTKECARNGFGQAAVSACCLKKPKCKTHKGYIWSYEPLKNESK